MKENEPQAESDGMIKGTMLAVDMDVTRQEDTSVQVETAPAADVTTEAEVDPQAEVDPLVDDAKSAEAAPAVDSTEAVHEAETVPQLDDHYKEAVQKSYDIQESIFYDVFEGFSAETYTASKPKATGSI
jgi:hypothetical protein